MSYLPFDASRAPRCADCNRMLDGEAEVNGDIVCSDCSSRARQGQRDWVAARQRRIEDDLA